MSEAPAPIRILLIEDNPGDALLLEATLGVAYPGWYVVTRAASMAEAKARAADGVFDVILVDLTLPDSEGLATLDVLRHSAPAAPIIALTGVTDEVVAMEAVRRGAQDYLIKGRSDAALVARSIHYAIDRQLVEEQLRLARASLEQKVRERTEELRKVNQTLRMISECNAALVHNSDEFELVHEICRIIVDVGGYRLAWVGYPQDDSRKSVWPVAIVGEGKSYLDDIQISWADTPHGQGPTGTAIRTGQPIVSGDFSADPRMVPWRIAAQKHDLHASISLPLSSGGKVFGALMLYANQPLFFDKDQVALLRELADDMAFGISALRARAERDRALEVAARRTEQLRALAAELTQTEHRERRRLARIIHDHLQQLLVAAKFGLGNLRAQIKTRNEQDTISLLAGTLDEAIRSARSLTAELTPQVLHDKGLVAGLEWLSVWMLEKHGLTVVVTAVDDVVPSTDEMQLLLYEAVRELLFNVAKHAGVNRADVAVRTTGSNMEVMVTDGGAGFDLASIEARDATTGGFGLFSIRERIGYLGGRMEVQSAPGRGSTFTLLAPLRKPDSTPGNEPKPKSIPLDSISEKPLDSDG
jgi:signal transduction histidine kinase/DNA-binding response OmpR family regulator